VTATAAVVGASGYAGGELLRILAGHPELEVVQATSRQYAGKTIGHVHPNLRTLDLRYEEPGDLASVDCLFAATPHGVSMESIDSFRAAAGTVVDLSADFRLPGESWYDEHYDGHVRPELLSTAEYGLPEINREGLRGAELVAAGGCNATAAILGLAPLVENDLLSGADRVVVDVKVGSSEGGAGGGLASSHPERSGVVRPYAPTGHRHEAEIEAHCGLPVSFTAHAVELVRGASATCHAFPADDVTKGDLWGAYRGAYEDEPFVTSSAGAAAPTATPSPRRSRAPTAPRSASRSTGTAVGWWSSRRSTTSARGRRARPSTPPTWRWGSPRPPAWRPPDSTPSGVPDTMSGIPLAPAHTGGERQ